MDRTSQTALVLSGGNALGAYLAGAYEHLHRSNIEPDWIVGASIGAVTGAILAGNASEQRLPKLSGPRVRLLHLAYQTAGHELAAKTFDYSPSSIRDRWAAGEHDMARGLALLEKAGDNEGRFQSLAIDPGLAAAAAEASASGARGSALRSGFPVGWLPFPRANPKAA
jgi:patatin-like phospholipase